MEGEGKYNKYATVQVKVFEESKDQLNACLQSLSLSSPTKITIVDVGSSQGRNSVESIKYVIEQIRLKSQLVDKNTLEFLIYYEDQQSNDFTTLIDTVNSNEFREAVAPHVFSSFIAESFYNRILPSNSVDFFLSYLALQWLPSPPTPLSGEIISIHQNEFVSPATFSETEPNIVEIWKSAAHNNLLKFLSLRAEEGKDDSGMFFVFPRKPADLTTLKGFHSFISLFSKALSLATQNNCLYSSELNNIAIPVYLRSSDEVKGVLQEISSLKLNDIYEYEVDYNFETAEMAVLFLLSVIKPTIIASLDRSLDSDDEAHEMRKQAFLSYLQMTMIKLITEDIPDLKITISLLSMNITRISRAVVLQQQQTMRAEQALKTSSFWKNVTIWLNNLKNRLTFK